MTCIKCQLKGHIAKNCRTKCFKCKRVGHSIKNCRPDSSNSFRKSTYHVDYANDDDDSFCLSYVNLISHGNCSNSKHTVNVKLNGECKLSAEFDSGSTVSVISMQKLGDCISI